MISAQKALNSAAVPPIRPSRSNFIQARGTKIHVRSWGREGAPKLFLLHGWMDCSASFQFFADALPDDWHVIAPDWRGYGLSEWTGQDTYWQPDLLADLDRLLNHYQPNAPVRLLGHSMGANFGALYAGTRPERIACFINVEGYGATERDPATAPRQQARWLGRLRQRPRWHTYTSFEQLAGRLLSQNRLLTAPRALFLARHLGRLTPKGRVVLRCDPRHRDFFANPAGFGLQEARACWDNIAAPVLWIEADDGSAESRRVRLGLDEIAARKSHIRNRSDAFFADTGHQVHLERPEELARTVGEFLNRVAPANQG